MPLAMVANGFFVSARASGRPKPSSFILSLEGLSSMASNSIQGRPCDRCNRKIVGKLYPMPDGRKLCKRCRRGSFRQVAKKRKERYRDS